MSEKKVVIQKIWGLALLFAGVSMFFAIPSKVAEIQTAGGYSAGQVVFLQICFYIMSLVLSLGGAKKLYAQFWSKKGTEETTKEE